MNIVRLNTVSLDGIIKKSSGGGGGVPINNQEKSLEITENGVTEVTADAGFTGLGKVVVNTNVASSGGGSGWTGHADVEGLKAIGWTDEDIAYYQEHGVNWNAEDDEYHKVTDDNKALYGVLTANNISLYKDIIVYLPKIDTSSLTSGANLFYGSRNLVAIPMIDTSSMTSLYNMFYGCVMLSCIPPLDISSVTSMDYTFYNCFSLRHIADLNTSKVTSMSNMIRNCYSLQRFPNIDMSQVNSIDYMILFCYSLQELNMDLMSLSNAKDYFRDNYSLVQAKIKNVKLSISLNNVSNILKESLLYIINNEAATSAITITLAKYAYTRLANDADIVAALAAHPNISLAK